MNITSMTNRPINKKINLVFLLVSIAVVLVLPFKKQIWYDETISMFCAKGIGHDLAYKLDNTPTISTAQLEALNTNGNVFHATVKDNANSYLYNLGLHWFTGIAGNSLQAYMLFSKLCGIAALIAFYMLCTALLGNSLLTSAAVLLLATDTNFIGMSHEIRAYAMGIAFITWAAVYFFKFTDDGGKPKHLLLLGLCCVGAVLSHFLSIYAVLTFLLMLLYFKKGSLFNARNLAAMAVPVALIGLFFALAYAGLQLMSKQNADIEQHKKITEGFNIAGVMLRSLRFFALNFKAVFPAFINKAAVSLVSFAAIVGLYVVGVWAADNARDKRNIHILFLLGVSGSIFLAALSVKSHHYTALYYRYYSFCIPFCCLATAYVLQVLLSSRKVKAMITGGIAAAVILPALLLFAAGVKNSAPIEKYNHIAIAQQIANNNVDKVIVPQWTDAFLIYCVLPEGRKIDYVRDANAANFTLCTAAATVQIPVIRSKD